MSCIKLCKNRYEIPQLFTAGVIYEAAYVLIIVFKCVKLWTLLGRSRKLLLVRT